MLRKNTQNVLLLFGVLLVVLLLWQRFPQVFGAAEETPTDSLAPPLLGISVTDVAGMKISSANGEVVSFQQTDTGGWEQVEPEAVPADQIDQATLYQTINLIISWRELTTIDAITELDTVGLSTPALESMEGVYHVDIDHATCRVLVDDHRARLPRILELFIGEKLSIYDLRIQESSLEDVFIAYTR